VFENTVLRRIFRPKRDEVNSRGMKCAGHVTRMKEERNVYKALVEKTEGKRPLGRPRRRREDGIRMGLRKISWGWSGFNWFRIGAEGGRF
jgi:hypothetical protein